MAEPLQSELIRVPESLDASQREELGERIIDLIQSRTNKGLDRYNKPFKKYSKSYRDSDDFDNAGKSNKVNLALTGDMLLSVEIINHGVGFITIGMESGDANDKAFYSKEKGRDFLGISAKDLQSLIRGV